MKTQDILDEVVQELNKAEAKHPHWPKEDVIHSAAIVAEESGELIRAANQYQYEGGTKEEMKKEAIQTAAMCIRFLKNLTILVMAMTLISCMDFVDDFHHDISPEVVVFVDRFYAEADANGLEPRRDLLVKLSDDVPDGKPGRSNNALTANLPNVDLNRDYVLRHLAQKTRRDSLIVEHLVYHELGHALLGRSHSENESSIMYASEGWLYKYASDAAVRSLMVRELFTQSFKE